MSHVFLFVYGTLTAKAQHPMGDLLRDGARLMGRGHICARLYRINDPDDPGHNSYPGALPSPDPQDRVYGELYEILEPERLLPAFDDFEACSPDWPEPHEFLRRKVEVNLEGGELVEATAYLYTWDVSDAEHIPSGRFSEAAPDVR